MGWIELLALNAAVSAACFLGLWLVSIRLKDVSFIDSWWAIGMVAIAWTSLLATGLGAHRILLVLLCSIWGLRLGVHLFCRWRAHGADRRYVTMLAAAKVERGWGFATASLLLVFALQAPLQFLVALPVQLGQVADPRPLGLLAWVGAAVAIVGIGFESIGDWQLARFKADPASAGKVLDTGLWRFTRHPNYFGDACLWWGLWLIAAETPLGAWSLPGPILMTVLLTRWSGVPTAEAGLSQRRPGYADYVRRTSAFVPWPPRTR
jgi:steroid 5-alpha reductase family enzyme